MQPFDKQPKQLKKGIVVNWVSVNIEDDFNALDTSTKLVFSSFKKASVNLDRYLDLFSDKPEHLLGTVFVSKSGPIEIHNIFVKQKIKGKQYLNPFAVSSGLKAMFDSLVDKPNPKCYIGKLDDDKVWNSLQRHIKKLEANYGITLWEWKN